MLKALNSKLQKWWSIRTTQTTLLACVLSFLAWCQTCMAQHRSNTVAIILGSGTSQQSITEGMLEEELRLEDKVTMVDTLVTVVVIEADAEGMAVKNVINGVNILNPDCSFTLQEWEQLGYKGRQHIFDIHNKAAGWGGRGRGNIQNARAVSTGGQDSNCNEGRGKQQWSSDHSGVNGCSFGCSAYGGWGGCSWLLGLSVAGLLYVSLLLMLPTILHKLCHRECALPESSDHPNISVVSKCYIATAQSCDPKWVKNDTNPSHSARNKFDAHADTCCAGPNWCVMWLMGELCEVLPYLPVYDTVKEISVAGCGTVCGCHLILDMNTWLSVTNNYNTLAQCYLNRCLILTSSRCTA